MFKPSYSHNPRSAGGRPSFGGGRPGGRPSFGGGNRFGGGRRSFGRNMPPKIDIESFIRKTQAEKPHTEEHIITHDFTQFGLDARLVRNILTKGYLNPTAIQDKTIPYLMDGRDVIGLANTGTGKTAAFLLPLIHKILNGATQKVLIVTPTRELAQQIQDELRSFSQGIPVWSALLIGGSDMRAQFQQLKRRPQIIIGTPGRIKDMSERRGIILSEFNNIVLDEVDRMLDMGFVHDIKELIAQLSPNRQSLFFSATVSSDMNSIIQSFVKDPITLSVKTHETSSNIDQTVIRVSSGERKLEKLEEMLQSGEIKKALIFGRTKRGVENLSKMLFERGHRVASIHGDKPQSKRQQALRMFKENVVSILVATDVAARGIDVQDVSHVINYELPATYEEYVHRIGRTGRADKKGVALTFVE